MTRFIYIDGEYVNVDTIAKLQSIGEEIKITYKDKTVQWVPRSQKRNIKEDLRGYEYIVQVIPCSEPMEVRYLMNDEDGDFAEEVDYLALCADGYIRGVSFSEGEYVLVDNMGSFTGIYKKDE